MGFVQTVGAISWLSTGIKEGNEISDLPFSCQSQLGRTHLLDYSHHAVSTDQLYGLCCHRETVDVLMVGQLLSISQITFSVQNSILNFFNRDAKLTPVSLFPDLQLCPQKLRVCLSATVVLVRLSFDSPPSSVSPQPTPASASGTAPGAASSFSAATTSLQGRVPWQRLRETKYLCK
jgi:hypothetical protein